MAPRVPIKFVQLPSFSTILPHTTSIFTAELLAILLALSNIHKTHYNFHILFSDSFSALQAINHNSSKNPIVLDILLKYNNLINHHYDLIFGWIPGHVGIKGNIEADKLARDMSNVITHILPIPNSDIFPTLRSIIFSKWQAVWNSNPNNKLYKLFPKLQHFSPLHQSFTRKDQIILNRLFIGHTPLTHSYGHTFLIKNNPLPVTIVNAS